MLTARYLTSVGNLPAIMEKVVTGSAPEKFNREHLAGIGFAGSNDRAVIPLLKDLGFLSPDGTPTTRYHAYRDNSRSKAVMGTALLEAYKDLFTINENPQPTDRKAIEGKFKSVHNATDRVAQLQAATFFALLELADLPAARHGTVSPRTDSAPDAGSDTSSPDGEPNSDTLASGRPPSVRPLQAAALGLRYNIEIHLPPTKEIEVYNAIFKALKEHLIDD